jgi:hypothetical protein
MIQGHAVEGRRWGSGRSAVIGIAAFVFLIQRGVLLAILTMFGVALALGLSTSSVGVVSEIGADGRPLYTDTDLAVVPQSVADDAALLAAHLFGKDEEKADRFVDELLAVYAKSYDKDVVILFNPGGWGYGPMDLGRPWGSILSGMQSLLSECNMDSQILTYQRSVDGLQGCCEEFTEILWNYSSKAEVLASRVRFLTAHVPDLKVIIAGESTGAQIGGEAVKMLSDDARVFCIQIGPPCWYDHEGTDRTLVISDNGIAPDSFSRGDLLTIARANFAELLDGSHAGGDRGTILKYLRAPGHDYWWDYPAVSSQITRFLEENVGIGSATAD